MLDRLEQEVGMVERHMTILRLVIEEEPIGIVALSDRTGLPNHKVRYSLRVLEEEEIIEPSAQGAVTTEKAEEFLVEHGARLDAVGEKLETLKPPMEDLP